MNENTPKTRKQSHDAEKKIEKYVISLNKVVGKGSYATVYLGRRISDSYPCAVKVIEKKIFANTYNIRSIQSQIDIMKKADHNNIVKLLDVYQTNNNMYIVTEFCEKGDLRQHIKKKKRLEEGAAVKLLKDIVEGFRYLHEREIIHRDLKPANILISAEGTCKISDFGFAKNLEYGENTILRSIVGTPLYMSPQILNKQPYTNKSDLWSLGLIFYEMIYGHTPWPAENQLQLLNNIMHKIIPFNAGVSALAKDFIKKCLKIKEDERMSWEQAFNHPLFSHDEKQNDHTTPQRPKLRNRSKDSCSKSKKKYTPSRNVKTYRTPTKLNLQCITNRNFTPSKTPSKTPKSKPKNTTPQRNMKSPWRN